eukprot:gene1109-2156_t
MRPAVMGWHASLPRTGSFYWISGPLNRGSIIIKSKIVWTNLLYGEQKPIKRRIVHSAGISALHGRLHLSLHKKLYRSRPPRKNCTRAEMGRPSTHYLIYQEVHLPLRLF